MTAKLAASAAGAIAHTAQVASTSPVPVLLLGPDGDPIVGATISVRLNSHRSNICKLLHDANLSHQFASTRLTWSYYWIHYWVFIGRRRGTLQNGRSHHTHNGRVAKEQPTMARVARTLSHAVHCESHATSTTCYGSDSSIRGHTRACIHAYGQNPSNIGYR